MQIVAVEFHRLVFLCDLEPLAEVVAKCPLPGDLGRALGVTVQLNESVACVRVNAGAGAATGKAELPPHS
jgi:hypothetical protein